MSERKDGTTNALQTARASNCDPMDCRELARKSVHELRQAIDTADGLWRPKIHQRRIDSTSLHLGRHVIHQGLLALEYLQHRLKASSRSISLADRTDRTDRTYIRKLTNSSVPDALVANKKSESQSEKRKKRGAIGFREYIMSERGDVPGWVLVVLMTTGLVTAIWAVAAPKLNAILKNSLDSMNNIR